MKKIILYCVFLGTVAFLPVSPDPVVKKDHSEFTLSQNQFAFHLFRAMIQQDTSACNKGISPLSIYLTAAMLYNGTAHDTRDSIEEALQASGLGPANLNGQCKTMLQQMPLEDEKVQLSILNSIWYNRRKLTLLASFENVAEQFYYSPVQSANFNGRTATIQINHWVDQNTHHQIPSIIRQTNPSDWMYLLDAFYFKSDWQKPFDPNTTTRQDFHVTPTQTKPVPYMTNELVAKTFSDTAFTMVELPYGNGTNYSMYVIIPEDDHRPIQDFALSFESEKLDYAINRMTDQYVYFQLPRWQYTYAIDDLKPIFNRLGMGNLFNKEEEADLSNMCKTGARKPAISKALYTASIGVNEEGTDAEVPHTSSDLGLIKNEHARSIIANHPFMYLLMEKSRNVVLFAGLVNDPEPVITTPASVQKPQKTIRHHKHLRFHVSYN